MPLFKLAHLLDIEVHWVDDLPDAGMWIPADRAVALRSDLTDMEVQCVLAHELGHATLGHSGRSERDEIEADNWAANMLLSSSKIARCMQLWPDSMEKWCDDLNVTPDILKAWLRQPDNYNRLDARLRLAS